VAVGFTELLFQIGDRQLLVPVLRCRMESRWLRPMRRVRLSARFGRQINCAQSRIVMVAGTHRFTTTVTIVRGRFPMPLAVRGFVAMVNGVRADGSRSTLGMGTPSRSSPACDWIRPQVTVRGIAGRRGGKGALAVRPASRSGIQLGCKAIYSSAPRPFPLPGERRTQVAGVFGNQDGRAYASALGEGNAGITGNESTNYARNGTKPA